jgi:5S rRNA maturation endonuclease (ribonuclease M5)
MVISYVPLGISSVCKYLKINKKEYLTPYLYKKFNYYIENKYCKYTFKKGKNKGYVCGKKCIDGLCKTHENNDIELNYCIGKSIRNQKCKRIVKGKNILCSYHKNNNIEEHKNDKTIEKYTNNLDLDRFRNIKLINIIKYLKINYKYEGNIIILDNKIIITNNKFYDNINNYSSYGAIDFYKYITKKDYKTTLKELSIILLFPSSTENNSKNPKNKIPLFNKCISINNIKEDKNNINNIKYYLMSKRRLNQKLIELYINKGLISSDDKNNCIFFNENRSYLQLKDITEKRIISSLGKSDFIEYKNADNPLYLFESPIEALSYITLTNGNIKGNFVSVNDEKMINKIDVLVNKYKSIEIYLCLDNDIQGNIFCEKIKENLKKYKIIFIRKKPKNKKFNEDLQKKYQKSIKKMLK